MDGKQDDLQFLGIFGIYKEAYKIVFSWRKIFGQITLLIVNLSIMFDNNILISNIIFWNVSNILISSTSSPGYERISDVISSEWATFWPFKAIFFTFLLIIVSLLVAISAVVYTIACIYTAREITFKKVMSAVPKVWKRVTVTFLCAFVAFFCYNIVASIVLIIWVVSMGSSDAGVVVGFILLVLYFIGLVYLTLIWQLASVVSVLEEARGIKAMVKSKALLKGNMWLATIIYLKLNVLARFLSFASEELAIRGRFSLGAANRTASAVICKLLLLVLILFGLVIQTVLYFVCKSYHHENIDKSALSDHLEVYLGDYVPVKAKDDQLEQV